MNIEVLEMFEDSNPVNSGWDCDPYWSGEPEQDDEKEE